jgi:hypothetical protein
MDQGMGNEGGSYKDSANSNVRSLGMMLFLAFYIPV